MSEIEILESVNQMPDASKLAIIDKIYSMIYKEDFSLVEQKTKESEARIIAYENNEVESYEANSVLENLK